MEEIRGMGGTPAHAIPIANTIIKEISVNPQMKKKFEINVPGGATTVLLHTCCAPCSSAIIECLMKNGVTPVIYYSNPNIYPLEEYLIRKNECTRYADSLGLTIIDDDYCHDEWLAHVKGLENEPERGRRCRRCFEMRLRRTARYAHENGISVEPYDDVAWWEQNWRKGGLSERRLEIIKQYGFYNQQYCGCEFSMTHDKDKEQTPQQPSGN